MLNLQGFLKDFEKLIKLYDLHIVKEKISLFEKKYGKTFFEFEKEVLAKEDFEKWDDYLEWKAYIKSLKFYQTML
ncbi:MAG: hypothetical protein GXO57_01785 [Thermodesulfobacteria bacterium]|nr:hypothetical protein [Thermodesulfobacteriota bacterium]